MTVHIFSDGTGTLMTHRVGRSVALLSCFYRLHKFHTDRTTKKPRKPNDSLRRNTRHANSLERENKKIPTQRVQILLELWNALSWEYRISAAAAAASCPFGGALCPIPSPGINAKCRLQQHSHQALQMRWTLRLLRHQHPGLPNLYTDHAEPLTHCGGSQIYENPAPQQVLDRHNRNLHHLHPS